MSGRVGIDNRRAADSATRYLLSLGHRKMGIITGDSSSGTSVDRLEGFLQALRSARIRPDQSMIHSGHNDMESGHVHAMQLLTRARPPDGDFLHEQHDGFGSLGRDPRNRSCVCPEEISLLGFRRFLLGDVVAAETHGGSPARERSGDDRGANADRPSRRASECSYSNATRNATYGSGFVPSRCPKNQ